MNTMKQNFIYIRAAHEYDAENNISAQRKSIYRYRQLHPDLPDHFDEIVDIGCSGFDNNAPGLTKLLQLVEQDKVGTIIVAELSRLTRNCDLARYYMEELFPKHRVHFIIASDKDEPTSEITVKRASE